MIFLGIFPRFQFCLGRTLFFQMQKHSQWLSNRGYLRHLEVLGKISRRKHPKGSNSIIKNCLHRNTRPSHNSPPASPKNNDQGEVKQITNMREQQILWDNFHLGRRIIQTPSVISRKKFEQDYRRHKQIVNSLTASNSKRALSSQFRVKKLQEYKENIEIQHSYMREAEFPTNHIVVNIQAFSFYRENPILDNLQLKLIYTNKNDKKIKRSTENFTPSQLFTKQFSFKVPKRVIEASQVLVLEVCNVKGLGIYPLGYLSFPCSDIQNYSAHLFSSGKMIGEAQISIICLQKRRQ